MSNSKIAVLFVCHGNICRSPMAEGLFLDKIAKENNQDLFLVESAGIIGMHKGEQADERMRNVANQHGISLETRSRQIHHSDFINYDYILAMDESNMKGLNREAPNHHNAKLLFMKDFDAFSYDVNVPDPWYGELDGFTEVYHLLSRCIDGFYKSLQKNHPELNR